jgi:membrane-bound lytic murein transglycosylase B
LTEPDLHLKSSTIGLDRAQEKGGHWGLAKFWLLLLFSFIPFLLCPPEARGNWESLIHRLIGDGFNEQTIRGFFSRPEVNFDPAPMSSKLETLVKNHSPKASVDPGSNSRAVYRGPLTANNLARARSYLQEHREVLEKISSQYCVPKEIIVSILLVETRLGDYTGARSAFSSLASMATCTELEIIRPHLPKNLIHRNNEEFAKEVCRQKADWAYSELQALILYAHINNDDPLKFPGSIYGAIGLCQFIPTSALVYGVDADGDGRTDLFAKVDAFYSIANYLKEHGWGCQMDRASQHKVIHAYNHSHTYANTVLAVAEKLKAKPKKK